MVAFKQVVAPFDGVVTGRSVDIGDLVTAGSTASTTPHVHGLRLGARRASSWTCPRWRASSIHVGMPAEVTAREFPGRMFHGQVDRTAEAIDPASGTLRVEVLDAQPGRRAGAGHVRPGHLPLPRSSTRPSESRPARSCSWPTGRTSPSSARTNACASTPIKIARDLGDVIEVADGLSSGESVVLNISTEITDGQKVAPVVADAPNPSALNSAHAISEGGD